MNLYWLWRFVCICLTFSSAVKSKSDFKLNGEVVKKVEIGFDFVEGNAFITYNDVKKSKGKIFYSEKKEVVAYKDEEIGHCLIEKITKHEEKKNEDSEVSSKTYHISGSPLDKVKAEKLAGKKILRFCAKYPITLLKEYFVGNKRIAGKSIGNNGRRLKRESDVIREKESQLSQQESFQKNFFEDIANADGFDSKDVKGKGIKRNVDAGSGRGIGHHPNIGQPATVDYHARIRNDLPSGAHPLNPIDITSSVTIATGPSHPVWSYTPSAGSHFPPNGTDNGQGMSATHGTPHHSTLSHSQQNGSQIHHHGQHHPNIQTVHQGITTHPSSSGQYLKSSGYYPPSSTNKSQQNIPHYPPSSVSKAPSNSPHYPPSIFSKPQQNTAYYPPSSTSKNQHQTHFPPSSVSKPQLGPAVYPSGKSHLPSPSVPSRPAYYPPSSFGKSYHNETSGDHGIQHGKTPISSQYSPISHPSHGYHPSSFPPSSTSKIHYSAPQSQNTSHSSFHHGVGVYAPQYPPSSTSKLYPQQGQYGTSGRSGVYQYPPSSTSKIHHSTPTTGYGGSHNNFRGISQYPPSSSSKLPEAGNYYAPQFPPSSTSKHNYSPSARDSFYSHSTVLERPSAGRNAYEPGSYPPSSSSKVHYSPHSHVMPAGGNAQYYPPSSSSKVNHSPPSSDQNHEHQFSYPPSSTSKLHYSHSPGGDTSPQIPQPPTNKNVGFPPSSTSKHHSIPSYHPQHYPPSSSSKQPLQSDRNQHHQSPAYYPPSSTSKFHETHQNISSTKQSSPPGYYYPPTSKSNLHHSAIHQTGGRITATGRVSITPGFSYYPPSSSSKNGFIQQGVQHDHAIKSPHYGPSSSSHHNDSLTHGSSGVSDSSGHGLYSPSHYPPSSFSETHPSHQPNGSVTDYKTHSKSLYPMEQHPSSSGGHHNPPHHNDSSPGHFPQGSYYPPSGHHSPIGTGHFPQYPPSSSSHEPQPPLAGRQPQFHQPPSSQDAHTPVRPCQGPRSLYSITTRTIVTPNGAMQRPVSVKTDGEYPCGGIGQTPDAFPYARYAPCSGTLTRNGQGVRSPCTANGNLRKSLRSTLPGPAVLPERSTSQQPGNSYVRTGKEQHERGYGYSAGLIMTHPGTQAELLNGMGHHHRAHFSKLQAAENSTSEIATDGNTGPENFEENGRNGKDVEVFERNEEEDEKSQSIGKPVKYQENEDRNKTKVESEEEVKEGDVLEPGDRILGKDGYTILEGFRGRVVSVTGQIGKTRAEAGKESRGSDSQETEIKSNSGQFRYSSDLGRYVKENGEKTYSNCHGEPTFTCSEFLGSNGRAKICKPNPRRNPDGSPC